MNKNFVKFFLTACISLVFVNAYVERINPSKSTNPDHPDHCWDKKANAYYKPRAEFYQRKSLCEKIWCHSDYSMDIHGCGSADIHGCEKLAIDYTKPYPECCPKFKCGEKIVTPPYS